MMIKQMTISMVLVTLGLFNAPAAALTVFADIDGDMLHDSMGTFNQGDIFTAGIYASVDDVHGGLAGFGVRMTFDESPISVNDVPSQLGNVRVDPQWDFLPATSVNTGVVTAGGSSLFGVKPGSSIHLFDAIFQATSLGTSILSMTDENQGFGDFAGFDGFDYDVSGELVFLSTEIKVVPVPPALIMFGSGLLGLISLVRRRHH